MTTETVDIQEQRMLDMLVRAFNIETAVDEQHKIIADSFGLRYDDAAGAKSAVEKLLKDLRDSIKAFMCDANGNPRIHEFHDVESDVFALLKDGAGARFLDFEKLKDSQIVQAARAGLLALNVGAYDGALKSSDLRISGLANEVKPNVHTGSRGPSLSLKKGR